MKEHTPLVSVICTCYNHNEFVIEALESVKHQSYPKIELIIVDNASVDGSQKTIKDWASNNPVEKVILNEKNLGINKSFNEAFKHISGNYYIDLAADDILLPSAIENHIINFKNHEFKKGISFANCENVNTEGEHISFHYEVNNQKKTISKPKDGFIYKNILESYYVCSPTLMVDTKIFKDLNGYDNELSFEDLDFLIRASRVYPFFFYDEITAQKRILPHSYTSTLWNKKNALGLSHRETYYKVYKKAFLLNENGTEDAALLVGLFKELKTCIKGLYYKHSFLIFMLYLKCKIRYYLRLNILDTK